MTAALQVEVYDFCKGMSEPQEEEYRALMAKAVDHKMVGYTIDQAARLMSEVTILPLKTCQDHLLRIYKIVHKEEEE